VCRCRPPRIEQRARRIERDRSPYPGAHQRGHDHQLEQLAWSIETANAELIGEAARVAIEHGSNDRPLGRSCHPDLLLGSSQKCVPSAQHRYPISEDCKRLLGWPS